MKAEIMNRRQDDLNLVRIKVSFDRGALRLVDTPFGLQVELPDAAPAGELGGPGLPMRVIRVALPPFSQPQGVSGESVSDFLLRDEPTMLAPLQRPRPGAETKPMRPTGEGVACLGDLPVPDAVKRSTLRRQVEDQLTEPIPAPPFEPPRPDRYAREAADPRPLARLLAVEGSHLAPVAVIGVSPVRLNADGLLEFSSTIEVVVHFVPPGDALERSGESGNRMIASAKPIHSRAQAQRIVDLTRMQVINPEAVVDISSVFPRLITHVDYLVITDNKTWNSSTIMPVASAGDLVASFQRLANWKATRGLKTRVVTVDDIVAGVHGNFTSGARDLQEVLRNFIKWAYDAWGVAWLLLGGDVNIIPVRRAPGAAEGHIDVGATDPPNENHAFWSGSFLKMNVVNPGAWWPGPSADHLLVRADNGMLIPYDSSGTTASGGLGWYFTTDASCATRTATPTQFVRVNGNAGQVNARLQWLYQWNTLPTDLYYADLVGPNYNLPGLHDWDLLNNGIYGQHTDSLDLDGVNYQTDISVGRAPVSNPAQADAFVNKVIAYEQFRRPDGVLLDSSYPRRMVLVSSDWGGPAEFYATTATPPGDQQFYHGAVSDHSLLKLKDVPSDLSWRLIAQVNPSDVRVIPYNRSASSSARGWHYAVSDADLSASETTVHVWGTTFHVPLPTHWAVVYGPEAELAPQVFLLDRMEQDGSMHDQEQLRTQIAAELPAINTVSRLYQDELDLTPAEAAAAPVDHLTEDHLRTALNAGPHFVSLSGHGNSNGCCWLSGAMAQNLTNGFHSFIGYADSCLTNQFDDEDAVSERLLYNPSGGAVAYIGNTRFSWIGVGDNFQRAFFHRLTSTRHLGLLNDIRTGMVNEATGFFRLYNKWAIFTLNLMGDPEMPVWVGHPATMIVAFPHVVDKRKAFTVTVQHKHPFMPMPLLGAVVHIRQGSFARIATTNAAGQATFDVNPAGLGELEVTVTSTGYVPFIDKARITGPAWVIGNVVLIDHQHGSALQTLIRLQMDPGIDGDHNRGWYAGKLVADYSIILDAATDAYITNKPISLFVDNTDEGGRIERFRFGPLPLRPPIEIARESMALAAGNGHAAETTRAAETPEAAMATGLAAITNGQPVTVEKTNGQPTRLGERQPTSRLSS